MKVIYKSQIRDRINRVITESHYQGREIESIELGVSDYMSLYKFIYGPDEPVENAFMHNGVKITKNIEKY